MASGLVFHVCLLTTLASVVTAAAIVSQEDGTIMRRQTAQNVQVHLGPGGEVTMNKEDVDNSDAPLSNSMEQPVQNLLKMQKNGQILKSGIPEVSYCDESYPKGTPNSNECIEGIQILREEDCRHAANVSGLEVATNWMVSDTYVNPDPYPKKCFIADGTDGDGKVHFNPSDTFSTPMQAFHGTPICQRIIYKNGTAGLDSDAGCTGDYASVDSYDECTWARSCEWGALFCQVENPNDMRNHEVEDAPRGCYRDSKGCYGFNNKDKDSINADTVLAGGKTPVCRLKTHVFSGRTTR